VLTYLPSRDELTAERCRRRLSTFVREAWPIVEPATPFVHGWHIDVLCEHLQAVSNGDIRRLIINVPPRTMKSLTTAVFWPCWEWLGSAHIRWLFASYAADLSTRDSVKCRRLIESRGGREDGTLLERVGYQGLLRLLHDGDDVWELTGDQNAKTKYETTKTGMRLATSVGGVATGEGGDRIIVDDPLNAKQARSEAERDAANKWWDETMTTRFNNSAAAAVIVMQRLHEDDLTGHLLDQGSWHHLCLPAEYDPRHPFVYPDRVKLPPRKVAREVTRDDGSTMIVSETVPGRELPGDPRTEPGELLEPVRLGRARLTELRRGLGSYGYAGQMLQLPAPDEGGMLKRGWWKRYEPESLPPLERRIASWDMRFSDSQSAASSYVVGQVWGVAGSRRYLLAQVRDRLSFTESLEAVKALHGLHSGITATLVEKKANGAAVIDALKARIPGLIAIEPEGGKEVRAAAVSPLIEAGDVWLPIAETIPTPPAYEPTPVADFIEECAVFPNGSHDDQVDSMSQALNWLANAPGKPKAKKLKGRVLR
jgi:predicted phage terminase large subunit-like protein